MSQQIKSLSVHHPPPPLPSAAQRMPSHREPVQLLAHQVCWAMALRRTAHDAIGDATAPRGSKRDEQCRVNPRVCVCVCVCVCARVCVCVCVSELREKRGPAFMESQPRHSFPAPPPFLRQTTARTVGFCIRACRPWPSTLRTSPCQTPALSATSRQRKCRLQTVCAFARSRAEEDSVQVRVVAGRARPSGIVRRVCVCVCCVLCTWEQEPVMQWCKEAPAAPPRVCRRLLTARPCCQCPEAPLVCGT